MMTSISVLLIALSSFASPDSSTTIEEVAELETSWGESNQFLSQIDQFDNYPLQDIHLYYRGSSPRFSKDLQIYQNGLSLSPATYLYNLYRLPPTQGPNSTYKWLHGPETIEYGHNNGFGMMMVTPIADRYVGIGFGNLGQRFVNASVNAKGKKSELLVNLRAEDMNGFQERSNSEKISATINGKIQLSAKHAFHLNQDFGYTQSNAAVVGVTPYTFSQQPSANPFDFNHTDLTRYAAQIGHQLKISHEKTLTTNLYGSVFVRDNDVQFQTLVSNNFIHHYIGDAEYFRSFAYVNENDDGYVLAGWRQDDAYLQFRLRQTAITWGVKEQFEFYREHRNFQNRFKFIFKLHNENFIHNLALRDSLGTGVEDNELADQQTKLTSTQVIFSNNVSYKRFDIYGILKYDLSFLSQKDWYQIENNVINSGRSDQKARNNDFLEIAPGLQITYSHKHGELYLHYFKGYHSHRFNHAFLGVENDTRRVFSTRNNRRINIQPEKHHVIELGWKNPSYHSPFLVRFKYHRIGNEFLAGQAEGYVNQGWRSIYNLEIRNAIPLDKLIDGMPFQLSWNNHVDLSYHQLHSGVIRNYELPSVIHSEASYAELISIIEENREHIDLYVYNSNGRDSLLDASVGIEALDQVSSIDIREWKGDFANSRPPYSPLVVWRSNLVLETGEFIGTVGIEYKSEQFADYLNIRGESADGSIGVIPAILEFNAQLSYSLPFNSDQNKSLQLYIKGSNLANQLKKYSRYEGKGSAIIVGGYRLIQGGVNLFF